jgi:hypothetical protein
MWKLQQTMGRRQRPQQQHKRHAAARNVTLKQHFFDCPAALMLITKVLPPLPGRDLNELLPASVASESDAADLAAEITSLQPFVCAAAQGLLP